MDQTRQNQEHSRSIIHTLQSLHSYPWHSEWWPSWWRVRSCKCPSQGSSSVVCLHEKIPLYVQGWGLLIDLQVYDSASQAILQATRSQGLLRIPEEGEYKHPTVHTWHCKTRRINYEGNGQATRSISSNCWYHLAEYHEISLLFLWSHKGGLFTSRFL